MITSVYLALLPDLTHIHRLQYEICTKFYAAIDQ